ncbi:signal recognition particle protein Srp19 [Thermococcus sp. JdF3]|jgi:signal recognition particle subunit SRP19|uniref:signal recognition particle protein Srp19 n=1 Tax=Thermococcus sp. JdF3 TaxID=1638258 RepID=UPI001439A5BF|nr:signal recognition particle protein Srp19 [Thermococcus sp. JdF3]NJE02271.1 signal recognition particle protein Srp19 [Thermococcus sp. JdF3]
MRKFVVWPSELDARLSRRYGRAVSRELAIDGPKVQEIADAALALGMRVIELDEEKLNPRLAGLDDEYRLRGMLRIESRHPKGKSLRMLGQKIREIRKTQVKPRGKKKRKSGKKKR